MGADQSTQTPNQLSFLACLLDKDYNSDHAFWVSLMSHASDRKLLPTPDSIFLNNIAAKYPLNFANLVLASVHEVCSIQKLGPGKVITPEQLNQLELALQLFISCISVAVANPKNSYLLEHLDSDISNRIKELRLKQSQSNKEKAAKKAKKSTEAEKTEKENVTENNDKPQTQTTTATKPKKPKTTTKTANAKTGSNPPQDNSKPSQKDEQAQKQNDVPSEEKNQAEDAEEPVFNPKPREIVEITPYVSEKKKANKTKKAENAQTTATENEKPKKKTTNAKRAASPQPSPSAAKNAAAANRAKSPQPKRVKRTAEEKAIIAQHRAMRQYDGHAISAFTNAVIELLFKDGVTLDEVKQQQPKKGSKQEAPKEKPKENKESQEKPKEETTKPENNNNNENNNKQKEEQIQAAQALLSENKALWIQNGEVTHLNEINLTRKELVDALLVISSLHIFYPKFKHSYPETTSSLLENLPLNSIILSTCRIAFRYMNERPPVTSELSLLLRSLLALLVRLFTNPKFRQEISNIHPQIFLRAIYAPEFNDAKEEPKKISLPLFDPLDPLSKETLSFLYMCALFQPGLVPLLTSKGYSNMFLYNLLWAAQLFFEKEGVNYIHSIILSTVLLIVADPKAAGYLNRPFKPSSKGAAFINCNFKPSTDKGLSFGDLLLEVLLNFCQRDSFLPSLICVFHMISPYVNMFSTTTAFKMMELFEHVNEKFPSFVPLFLEVFATIVQQKDNSKNGFCPIIFSKQSLFKQIKNDSPSVQKSLPIILKYLKKARLLIKKENKPKIDINEVSEILAKIDTEKLFPQPQMFIKHPHIFGGEIEKTWNQWADLIFQLTCEKDVKSIRELRSHLLSNQNSK
ncbi:hypothetical protein M9Y10_038942 [Tritrichomonas musculus]|uniref:Uncharacterized protein n=1 Tax=Tritrichomonas musculus TaxID=1915356 RepID=A0ABR2KAK2_9EUKA